MLSKQVSDRESSSRAVQSAFRTHGELAANAIKARLAPAFGGAEVPDLVAVVQGAGRLLELETGKMIDADIAHTRELGDDEAPRNTRDQAQAAVVALVTSMRLALTGRFGEDFGGRLGLSGKAPDTAADVLSWGRQVRAALIATELPAVDTAADDNDEVAVFSKQDAIDKLTRRLATLEKALAVTADEVREAETTQRQKNEAIASYDDTFRFAAGLLEVLLRAAGYADHADRVRPSVRRPGQTVVAAEGGQPANPTPEPTPDAG